MSHKYRYLYSALLEKYLTQVKEKPGHRWKVSEGSGKFYCKKNTVCSVSVVLHKARSTKMLELLYLYLEHNMFYINL